MNMDVSILQLHGNRPREISGTVVRELMPADLALLGDERRFERSPLKRLSHRHHNLARKLAEGRTTGEAAVMCGYDPGRVSILQSDPAFSELIEFYTRELNEQYRDLHEQLSEISGEAAEEIMTRLENEPEKIALGALMELTKMGADRTGFGPQTSSMNINLNVGTADRLKLARERVQQRRIEGESRRIEDGS